MVAKFGPKPGPGVASGVDGLSGNMICGGGSGSGFSRLFCKLTLRKCKGAKGVVGVLEGSGAEVSGFSNDGDVFCSDGRLIRPSWEGCRVSRAISSRVGALFLMPRRAEDRNSDRDDLDDGGLDRSGWSSISESESRPRSRAPCAWPTWFDVSPEPDMASARASRQGRTEQRGSRERLSSAAAKHGGQRRRDHVGMPHDSAAACGQIESGKSREMAGPAYPGDLVLRTLTGLPEKSAAGGRFRGERWQKGPR